MGAAMSSVVFNMDCMEAMREMPDKCFDLAVVDPVYGDVPRGGYMTGKGGGLAKQNQYNQSIWNQKKTCPEYFQELFRVSKNQIIWGGNYFVEEIGINSPGWVVWDKCRPDGMGYSDFEIAWTSFPTAARMFRFCWNGMLQGNMASKEIRIHQTQKPVALYRWIFQHYAKPGDRILDTHLGSGSSRIAAYDAGLDFTGFEIDKDYFQAQEERFAAHIAQTSLFVGDAQKEDE